MALTDTKVRAAKPLGKSYKLTDGDGMHLMVHTNGSKYWRLQYRFGGKQKMLVLGGDFSTYRLYTLVASFIFCSVLGIVCFLV